MGSDAVFHCYVMTNKRSDLEHMANKMLEVVEDAIGGKIRAPIFLSTGPLDPATAKTLRKFVAEHSPDKGEMLRKAKNFHFTFWGMKQSDPENSELMKIH
jgi:hypothetical protein